MTYTVSSGTLNPSIPYHTIPSIGLRKCERYLSVHWLSLMLSFSFIKRRTKIPVQLLGATPEMEKFYYVNIPSFPVPSCFFLPSVSPFPILPFRSFMSFPLPSLSSPFPSLLSSTPLLPPHPLNPVRSWGSSAVNSPCPGGDRPPNALISGNFQLMIGPLATISSHDWKRMKKTTHAGIPRHCNIRSLLCFFYVCVMTAGQRPCAGAKVPNTVRPINQPTAKTEICFVYTVQP